jgi:predicted DNA-binding antitoxin AbrB/MazE fold protein
MSIQFDATYREGVIHPAKPLALPENTEIRVLIVPRRKLPSGVEAEIDAMRPISPKMTPEEFDELVSRHSIAIGSLPADFSREDIYQDHD